MRGIGIGGRLVSVLAAGLVAGCAGGPLDGLWPFGGERPPARAPAGVATSVGTVGSPAGMPAVVDETVLVPALRVAAADRGRQGVILRAEGIAPTQGFFAAELRRLGRGADGIETVEFRARPPLAEEPVGPVQTRLLTVGRFYSNHEMRGIRGFRILAAQGSVSLPAP